MTLTVANGFGSENDQAIRTITLNRPDRRNAMTPEMQQELICALNDAAASSCRVVVLRGAGDAFCSGLDLEVLRASARQSRAQHMADAERVARLFRTLYELPKPTIAAVHGPAIAGGTGLATLCDFTLAASGVKFGYTETRIGFVPALVSAFVTLQIGERRARDLLMSGRLFDAEEAYRVGLVTEVVAANELAEAVSGLAGRLIANSPEALTATKRLMTAQNKQWLDTAIQLALEANAAARETADFREGTAAFLEKRKPGWQE